MPDPTPDAPAPTPTQYTAVCHCRALRLPFTLPAALPAASVTKIRCNCSICTRNGYLLCYPRRADVVFPPAALLADPARVGAYRLGDAAKPHVFCRVCGSSMWIDFAESKHEVERELVAVNMRMIDGIEDWVGELQFREVDGKRKLSPPYQTD